MIRLKTEIRSLIHTYNIYDWVFLLHPFLSEGMGFYSISRRCTTHWGSIGDHRIVCSSTIISADVLLPVFVCVCFRIAVSNTCVVLFVLFVFVLCLVCRMFPVSLYCPFLIPASGFSIQWIINRKKNLHSVFFPCVILNTVELWYFLP